MISSRRRERSGAWALVALGFAVCPGICLCATVELRQLSVPAGIVSSDNPNLTSGTTVRTQAAPAIASGLYFYGWNVVDLVAGNCQGSATNAPPLRDSLGRAVNPVTFTPITGNYCAIASYVPGDQDTSGLGVPDWVQYLYYGTLGVSSSLDTDADSYTLQQEVSAATSPLVVDTYASGGASEGASSN